jgi:GntR family transcriptional regulator
MWLPISSNSPVSIFEQIVSRVTFAVAAGDLEPGTLIPSVRDLAHQLLVHPNTVAKAFQELDRLGILTARRGRGMEVTPEAPELCRQRRREVIRERLRDALHEAVGSRLPAKEIRQLFNEELQQANGEVREGEQL